MELDNLAAATDAGTSINARGSELSDSIKTACAVEVATPKDVDVNGAELAPPQSPLSASASRQRRFQQVAWIAVIIEIIIGGSAFAASIIQEARTFIVMASNLSLFWIWLVWIQSLASGSPHSLRMAAFVSYLMWMGANFCDCMLSFRPVSGILIHCLLQFAGLACAYKLLRAMNDRIRYLFHNALLFEQIVALLGRWLAAAPVVTYKVVGLVSSAMARQEAGNNFCSVVMGRTCGHINCQVHFAECGSTKVRDFYQNAPELLQKNATAVNVVKYLHAEDFADGEADEFQARTIVASVFVFLLAEAVMSKIRRIGVKTLAENRVMLREKITFGSIGLHAAALLMWIDAAAGGYVGSDYYKNVSGLYFATLFSLLFCLAWMVRSSYRIPREELSGRAAQNNDSLQMTPSG